MMLTSSKPLWILNTTFFCILGTLSADSNIPFSEEKAIQESFKIEACAPGSVLFNPPEGWHLADPKALPSNVKVMVVGKGSSDFPPSMNLVTEPYKGTLKQYLKIVKAINDNNGDEWKDLGSIRTEAGEASLSQVDIKSKWGTERLMHVILLRNDIVYILTAAALKEEFPKFYKEFFQSMRSLRINKDVYDMVQDEARRSNLKKTIDSLSQTWISYYKEYNQNGLVKPGENIAEAAFQSQDFQTKYWSPFKTMLGTDYSDMGASWQQRVLEKVKNGLVE